MAAESDNIDIDEFINKFTAIFKEVPDLDDENIVKLEALHNRIASNNSTFCEALDFYQQVSSEKEASDQNDLKKELLSKGEQELQTLKKIYSRIKELTEQLVDEHTTLELKKAEAKTIKKTIPFYRDFREKFFPKALKTCEDLMEACDELNEQSETELTVEDLLELNMKFEALSKDNQNFEVVEADIEAIYKGNEEMDVDIALYQVRNIEMEEEIRSDDDANDLEVIRSKIRNIREKRNKSKMDIEDEFKNPNDYPLLLELLDKSRMKKKQMLLKEKKQRQLKLSKNKTGSYSKRVYNYNEKTKAQRKADNHHKQSVALKHDLAKKNSSSNLRSFSRQDNLMKKLSASNILHRTSSSKDLLQGKGLRRTKSLKDLSRDDSLQRTYASVDLFKDLRRTFASNNLGQDNSLCHTYASKDLSQDDNLRRTCASADLSVNNVLRHTYASNDFGQDNSLCRTYASKDLSQDDNLRRTCTSADLSVNNVLRHTYAYNDFGQDDSLRRTYASPDLSENNDLQHTCASNDLSQDNNLRRTYASKDLSENNDLRRTCESPDLSKDNDLQRTCASKDLSQDDNLQRTCVSADLSENNDLQRTCASNDLSQDNNLRRTYASKDLSQDDSVQRTCASADLGQDNSLCRIFASADLFENIADLSNDLSQNDNVSRKNRLRPTLVAKRPSQNNSKSRSLRRSVSSKNFDDALLKCQPPLPTQKNKKRVRDEDVEMRDVTELTPQENSSPHTSTSKDLSQNNGTDNRRVLRSHNSNRGRSLRSSGSSKSLGELSKPKKSSRKNLSKSYPDIGKPTIDTEMIDIAELTRFATSNNGLTPMAVDEAPATMDISTNDSSAPTSNNKNSMEIDENLSAQPNALSMNVDVENSQAIDKDQEMKDKDNFEIDLFGDNASAELFHTDSGSNLFNNAISSPNMSNEELLFNNSFENMLNMSNEFGADNGKCEDVGGFDIFNFENNDNQNNDDFFGSGGFSSNEGMNDDVLF